MFRRTWYTYDLDIKYGRYLVIQCGAQCGGISATD